MKSQHGRAEFEKGFFAAALWPNVFLFDLRGERRERGKRDRHALCRQAGNRARPPIETQIMGRTRAGGRSSECAKGDDHDLRVRVPNILIWAEQSVCIQSQISNTVAPASYMVFTITSQLKWSRLPWCVDRLQCLLLARLS